MQDIGNISLELSGLDGPEGKKIDSNHLQYYPVYYVPNPPHKDYQKPGGWPDALLEKKQFDVKAGDIQPVWIEIYVPEGTSPGKYTGTITVKRNGVPSRQVKLSLNVWDFSLPARPFLKTAFGFLERDLPKYHAVEPGSPEFRELADRYRENMLNHRISFRSIQSRPRYILTEQGRIKIDFSEFDREVEKYLSGGLTCFAVGLGFGDARSIGDERHFAVTVYDEVKGQDVKLQFGPAFSERFQQVIKDVYQTWEQHLKDKGWTQFAYNYIVDEPPWPNPFVEKLLNTVHGFAPEIKTAVPMTDFPQDMNEIKNLDIWIYHRYLQNTYSKYLTDGHEFWWYISWDYLLTTQDLMTHRTYCWDMWRNNITGLLCWAVNSWTANPWENLHRWARNPKYTRPDYGNALLVYPGETGPVNTMRMKVLRDSIEDYDYLCILQNKIELGREKNIDGSLLREAEKLVSSLSADLPQDPEGLREYREKAGKAIENLSLKTR